MKLCPIRYNSSSLAAAALFLVAAPAVAAGNCPSQPGTSMIDVSRTVAAQVNNNQLVPCNWRVVWNGADTLVTYNCNFQINQRGKFYNWPGPAGRSTYIEEYTFSDETGKEFIIGPAEVTRSQVAMCSSEGDVEIGTSTKLLENAKIRVVLILIETKMRFRDDPLARRLFPPEIHW
jgi:hypothetical protein